jgi:hypothetical protein
MIRMAADPIVVSPEEGNVAGMGVAQLSRSRRHFELMERATREV